MKYLYIIIISIIILLLLYIYIPYINIEKFTTDDFLFNTYPLIFQDSQDSNQKLGTFPTNWQQDSSEGVGPTYINILRGDKGDKGIQGVPGPNIECSGDVNIDSINSSNDLQIDVNELNLQDNSSINFNNKICFDTDKCIDGNFIDKVNEINTISAPALTKCQTEKNSLESSLQQLQKDYDQVDQLNNRTAIAMCKLNNNIENYYKPQISHLDKTIHYALDEIQNNWVKKGNADFDDLKSDVKQQYAPKFNFPLIKFISDSGEVISTYPDRDTDIELYNQVSALGPENEINITIPRGLPGNPGPRGPTGPNGPSGDRGRECFTNYEKFTDISLTNIAGPFIRFINQDTGEIQATIPKNFPSEKEIQDSDINVIDIPLYSDPDLKGPNGPTGNRGGPGYSGPQGTCCPPLTCWSVSSARGYYRNPARNCWPLV